MSLHFTIIPMGVSLVLRQSSLHSTHYSHLLFTPVFIFLTLVSSTEEGHICKPPPEEEEFLAIFILLLWLLFWPPGKRAALGGHEMGWGELLVAASDSLEEKLPAEKKYMYFFGTVAARGRAGNDWKKRRTERDCYLGERRLQRGKMK